MIEAILKGVESIRVMRADANLRITGCAEKTVARSDRPPTISQDAAVAEVSFEATAELTVRPGVIVEVKDCSGNLEIDHVVTPLKIDAVGGNLSVESVSGVVVGLAGGNLECRNVDGDALLERVGGSARFSSVGGKVFARFVGGKLSLREVGEVAGEAVGGKLKVTDVAGKVAVETVGGRLVIDGAGGDVSVAFVGGHASASRISGGLSLPAVGGAFDLRGPYPSGAVFSVKSRGRARIELGKDESIELSARTRWGKICVVGAEPNDLKWTGHNRLEGLIGVKTEGTQPAKLEIETTDGDIMLIGAEAAREDYDYCRSRRAGRFGRRFAEQFGDFAREWGEGIPEFVGGVADAVRKFVAESGIQSAQALGGVADDVREGVGEVLKDIERALSELRGKVPDDVGERLAKLGRDLGEAVARAAKAARGGSGDVKRERRTKVREAAREMAEAIREVAERARRSAEESRADDEGGDRESAESGAASEERAAHNPREQQIMKILEAVRAGDIELEEADDLIRAWFDVDAVTGNGNETG